MTATLLDTHVFVWALTDPKKLPDAAIQHLQSPGQALYLSIASAWELAIKSALGKISVPRGLHTFVAEGCRHTGVRLLGVELAHVVALEQLPHHHRDPFDRMMIAQAQVEGMALLSFDGAMDAYQVARA